MAISTEWSVASVLEGLTDKDFGLLLGLDQFFFSWYRWLTKQMDKS